MKKIFNLNFFRVLALIAILIGAVGSLILLFYAGHSQKSVILIALFTLWVLSPFVGVLIADRISKRWTVITHMTLYWLILVITLGSLISYSEIFGQLGAKPAFKFLVIPLISWLLIVTVIPLVSRLSTNAKPKTVG
jgi:hypothetical protein